MSLKKISNYIEAAFRRIDKKHKLEGAHIERIILETISDCCESGGSVSVMHIKGTVIVSTNSQAARHEILFKKEAVLAELNKKNTGRVFRDIIFRGK